MKQISLMPDIVDDKEVNIKIRSRLDLWGWREAEGALHYLSLGGGRQSSVLYLMAINGLFEGPRPSVAFFADTGSEPKWVYEQIEILGEINDDLPKYQQIPIVIAKRSKGTWGALHVDAWVSAGFNTSQDIPEEARRPLDHIMVAINERQDLKRWTQMPAYTESGAPLKRTCTSEYKIKPQERMVRAMKDYLGVENVVGWRGHTMDEVRRAKNDDRQKWYTRWPLLEKWLTDDQVAAWAKKTYGLTFRWSACFCCPFILRDPKRVRDLYDHDRESFQSAVIADLQIRTSIPRTKTPTTWLSGPGQRLLDLHGAWEGLDEKHVSAVAEWRHGERWLDPHGYDDEELPLFTGADLEMPSGLISCDSGWCGL